MQTKDFSFLLKEVSIEHGRIRERINERKHSESNGRHTNNAVGKTKITKGKPTAYHFSLQKSRTNDFFDKKIRKIAKLQKTRYALTQASAFRRN